MSDTGDSDDNPIETYINCRRRVGLGTSSSSNQTNNNNNNKRKIVMKIEFDDSDEDDNSDISYSDEEHGDDTDDLSNDEVKPSTSNRKRLLQSSDDDSDNSNNSEIRRKPVRGRKIDKNPIISEEDDDPDDNSKYSTNNNDVNDGFNSDSSSNDALEKCPICLFSFRNQEIGVPNICEHRFCALCIEEWSKNVQTCPIDRQEFITINVYEKFTTKNISREIKVIKQIDAKNSNNDDVTYCEICQQGNREDVMLLCDGCNQGFHIFCLTPPLEQIPEGFWYCDNCFDSDEDTDITDDLNALYDDIRDLGIPESRLRITEVRQPRILRTRQSERIRASIVARTRSGNSNNNNDIDINAPSTSRALIEHAVNGGGRRRIGQTTTTTTTTTTLTTTTRKTTKRKSVSRKRNTIRRRRRKTKKPRSRTYVVEYDVNNFDDKFALKTTKKYIRKKRTKRRTKGRRKSKLTHSQGIITERNFNQKNGRRKKYAAEQMGIKRLNKCERPINSSQGLSLFGNANDLEYFSDSDNNFEENEFIGGGGGDGYGGSTAVQTAVRFGNIENLRHRKGIKPNIQPSVNGPIDLLSNLLDMQDRFLNSTREDRINAVRIGSDGSINFGANLNVNQRNLEKRNDPNTKETEVNSNDIIQAPMFPWNNNQRNNGGQGGINRGGGGGGGYNNRFNNQSNYRNSGGGGGGNYRHSTGGMGGHGNNNNFRFQMNQNNNSNNPNFTPNYRDRFNRNNQRNRRNNNTSNSNDINNDQNPNFNNNNNSLLNRQLNSPNIYNDDNSNQIDNLNNSSAITPQQEQQTPPARIITSEEVNNSILGLKPSTSSTDNIEDSFRVNRNNLNPPPLHVPPLNMPPPLNFTPLHYPTISQPPLTPSLNHPPPLMGTLITPMTGSMIEPHVSMSGPAIRSITGPAISPVAGSTIDSFSMSTIGSMMIDFSQPPPPPPPLPEAESTNQNKTESLQNEKQSSTSTDIGPSIIGPQPLIPPPWNENLFKLATDYCDDDNDDDCPNFSVYSAESLQVANSTAVQNIHVNKAQEDEFDADEDLVQLGDDDDIPNSIDNSENRNRIEFKIIGPKLYKPDNKTTTVDEKLRESKKSFINKDKNKNNIITEHDKTKTESQPEIKNIEDDKTEDEHAEDETLKDKRTEDENSDKDSDDDEIKLNDNNDTIEETNDDDGSSINDLTPVTYNDLEKPTNETDTDTTTNTPLINIKNKKGVLELYDDSDWEELNIEREQLRQKIAMESSGLIGPQLEKDQNDEFIDKDDIDLELLDTTEFKDIVENEEITDRSYTPCLDEKDDHDDVPISEDNSPPIIASSSLHKKNEDAEKDESGIEGIETELISDAEIIVGEQGKSSKKKDEKKRSDDKNDGKNNVKKSRRNETFKKVTKNQRERNYRVERSEAARDRPTRHSKSRSHSNDKENKDRDKNRRSRERRNSRNRFRRVRRKEIVRYNVRNIINQPRTYKDRYGRDTSRPARSRSRSRPIRISRSRSRSRSHIRTPVRSRSRSLSSIRKNVRSFSISPSPLSPPGYRGRRPLSPRHVRRFTPVGRRRSRTPLRIRSRSRSRSNSISDRVTGAGERRHPSSNRMRQRSLSNSSKSKSPQAYTPAEKRSGSVLKNRKRKRSKERKKRKTRRRNSSISPPPQQQMILQHPKRLSRQRERTSPNIIAEPVTGAAGVGNRKKKSRRSRTKSPVIDHISVQNRGWTTSPEYNPNEKPNDVSWTPPIQSPPQHGGFRVMFKEPRKKRDKKKKTDKRKERNAGNNRKEKRNKNKDKTPQAPSKEVFASGDNILVSVSFNKDTTDTSAQPQQTTVVTLPPTRAEIVSNRRQSSIERQRSRRNKDQSANNQGATGSNQPRQRKHRKINIKPVAIIDLDRSPFQVIQVPRDIIVLTDSENENDQRLNEDGAVGGGTGAGDRRSSSVGLDEQQQQIQKQLQQQEQQHRENSITRSVEMNDDDEDNNNHHHHHHENGHHRLRQIDDDDDDDDEMNNNKTPERKNDRSDLPDDSYSIQQLGPKTPPEPPIVKFALSTKYRIKPRNPLHEEQEREDQQELEEERERERERERLEIEQQQLQQQQLQQQQQQHEEEEEELENQQQQQQNITKIGPNTPPESGPRSPDVYDPFDPTKSPSASPESQFLEEDELPSHSTISDKDLTNNESVLDRERKLDKNNMNPADLVKALMNTTQDLSKLKKCDQQQYNNNNNNNNSNLQVQSIDNDNLTAEEQQQSKSVQVLSNVLLSLGKSHHHIPLISSPPPSSSLKQQQQSQGFTGVTKLPQNMSNKTSTGGVGSNSNNYRHNGSSNDDIVNEVDSPYSPCSDDFDDLFDPPPETVAANNRNRNKNASKNTHKYPKTVEIFDNLFGSTSPVGIGSNRLPLPGLGGFASSSARKQRTKTNKKTSVKVAKIPGVGKIDEEQIKIYDDLPNSAVELQVKDKFLRKLNRQERVVEEVKLVLKPHYNRKHITKDEYKDILRRSVPKICHSKSGEINPKKIQNLIEAYVKKFRHRNKLGIGMNTGQVSTAVKCAAYLKKL